MGGPKEITAALAAFDPGDHEYGCCVFCHVPVSEIGHEEQMAEAMDHDIKCLWRAAVAETEVMIRPNGYGRKR